MTTYRDISDNEIKMKSLELEMLKLQLEIKRCDTLQIIGTKDELTIVSLQRTNVISLKNSEFNINFDNIISIDLLIYNVFNQFLMKDKNEQCIYLTKNKFLCKFDDKWEVFQNYMYDWIMWKIARKCRDYFDKYPNQDKQECWTIILYSPINYSKITKRVRELI
jgi:hypothetical protein